MKQNIRIHVYFISAFVLILFTGCANRSSNFKDNPQRIISLAPSITETLFALHLGSRVVGVTSYCLFPPCAKSIEKIGGYSDANVEKIVSLKPDLVLLLEEHEKQRIFLDRFKIRTMTIYYNNIAAICSSFAQIGRVCGVSRSADSLIAQLSEKVHTDCIANNRPSMLICVGRDNPGKGKINRVFVASRSTFYNDLIFAAGAKNAYPDSFPAYPEISAEGIMALDPDIIVDIASSMQNFCCDVLMSDWHVIPRLSAVKNDRIYCVAGDYATIPGPRISHMIDDLHNIILGKRLEVGFQNEQ